MEDVQQRIRGKFPSKEEQEHINSLTSDQIIAELIYAKGSYVYRAGLIQRLMEMRDK